MEQPGFRSYDRDLSAPSENSRASYLPLPEVSRLAGHFLTEKYDKNRRRFTRGAAKAVVKTVMQPEEKLEAPQNVQYSAWHRIETDGSGHAKTLQEQGYGQAMQLEVSTEQGALGHQGHGQASARPAPHGVAAAAVLNAARGQSSTDPGAFPAKVPPISSRGLSQPRTALPYRSMARPSLPSSNAAQRSLSPGSLTQDPEHMLEANHPSLWKRVIKSPWTWLAVGIVMIIYFV